MSPKQPPKHNGKKYLTIIVVLLILFSLSYVFAKIFENGLGTSSKKQIAVIKINGPITSDGVKIPLQKSGASAETLIEFLDKAEKTERIKAVLLDINSPGGTVVASRQVAEKVKSIQKPVVAFINDIGTSGAFWVATAADKVVADPLSITGSIGVLSSYLEFSKLFEKYGVTYEELKSGKYKDLASPFKELTEEERAIVQKKLDRIHRVFIEEVARNRNLPLEDIKKIATGEYFLGEEAQQLNLVDMLGNRDTAINLTKQLAQVEEAELLEFEESRSIIDILTNLETEAFFNIGRGIGAEVRNVEIKETPGFYT